MKSCLHLVQVYFLNCWSNLYTKHICTLCMHTYTHIIYNEKQQSSALSYPSPSLDPTPQVFIFISLQFCSLGCRPLICFGVLEGKRMIDSFWLFSGPCKDYYLYISLWWMGREGKEIQFYNACCLFQAESHNMKNQQMDPFTRRQCKPTIVSNVSALKRTFLVRT